MRKIVGQEWCVGWHRQNGVHVIVPSMDERGMKPRQRRPDVGPQISENPNACMLEPPSITIRIEKDGGYLRLKSRHQVGKNAPPTDLCKQLFPAHAG